MSGYDVIGDVHGEADKLTGLLRALGYRNQDRSWRHRDRVAVFVGDLIDRGAQQRETIAIVRPMVEARAALVVLGNHEFNAIAWATPDPRNRGEYLRTRDEHHRHQHEKFLAAVGEDSPRHVELVEWFKTLPMWLDLDGLRVVHACWDEQSFEVLRPRLNADGSMSAELVVESNRKGTATYDAVEIVLKGPEIELGDSRGYRDKETKWRTKARFRWWRPDATTLRDAAEIPANAGLELPNDPIDPPVPPYAGDVPVIIGHYWRTGTPEVITPKVACVDYSAVKGGPLVAYRWDGETELTSDHFQAFP
jgi:hypothetical protein